MLNKFSYRNDYASIMNLIINYYRVASTFKAYCIYIHYYVTEIADYLSFSLIITGLTTDITGIKPYTIST